ncbi:MAG TPA: hypothetical protein VFR66_15810 [Burkholderiales bacterium]|nr:hypothetical protein [Burkholderiales bacterium]
MFAGKAAAPIGPIPLDAHLKGMWSPVAPWPVIGIHAVLLPEGRVPTYGTDTNGRQTGLFTYDVGDPAAGLDGGHLTLPNGADDQARARRELSANKTNKMRYGFAARAAGFCLRCWRTAKKSAHFAGRRTRIRCASGFGT